MSENIKTVPENTGVRKKTGKKVHINNRTDKPDNIVEQEYMINRDCAEIERELPSFLSGFFSYMKSALLPMSRREYLRDIRFFLKYLTAETNLTKAGEPADITVQEFRTIRGEDVNHFLDYCRNYSVERDGVIQVYTDSNKTRARKKSALSVLFKNLYREGVVPEDITGKFYPIRVQNPGEHEIKALQDDEVMIMLDAVSSGSHLTPKEYQYWKKTRRRDKAILILFLTYGLRLSELQQLNVSSFNFSRGEFKIYRKRNKESLMPLNNRTVQKALHEYIDQERPPAEQIQEGDEDALFLSLQGRRMTQRQIRNLVKKYTSIALKTSRDAGYSPHKLRATAASSLIGRGNSIFDVQELLDHEHVTTTQLYARHRLNAKRDLVAAFEWDDEFDRPGQK